MPRFDTPDGATPIKDASGLLVEGVFTLAALKKADGGDFEPLIGFQNKFTGQPRP